VATLRIVDRYNAARTGIGSALPTLSTPTYFPAISSICSTADPGTLIRLLTEARYPRALVSAYDCKNRIPDGLSGARRVIAGLRSVGCMIILDSGAFECQVLGTIDWSRANYHEVSAAVPHDILMSFDAVSPSVGRRDGAIEDTDHPHTDRSPTRTVNVVHGQHRASLLENIRSALSTGPCAGIAVPDRDCGPDLLSRTRTIAEVRRLMDKADETLLLHILGCGNPVVMAAYVVAGADTFDSLDWAQGAVDIRSLTLTEPTLLRGTGCRCKACGTFRGPDVQIAMLHNLLFFQEFSAQLRVMVRDQTILDFLHAFTGRQLTQDIFRACSMSARD